MINIASIYEKMDNYHFDFDYYLNIHMPMSIKILSNAEGFKGVKVERGIDISNTIDSTYVAMCHYYFDTLENFMPAFIPHAEKLQDDVRNYTNIEPTIQINEVELAL
ncbi:Ethyl tert-butyl ether degradation EthD [Moritella viscosa]|uniref:EthD family reductase n=1 Tax=Moritella viscosa TaxID=80854 RepID=UPI0009242BE5|nr:EthD family reductase [Moritella viscosa]SGY95966.1 Ethyl tert-butyl ether degradation EthD [Moritella viscosa]